MLASAPKQHLWEILDICLRDKRQARILEADGSYVQQRPEEASDGRENLGTQLRVEFSGSSDSEYLIPTRSAHLTA